MDKFSLTDLDLNEINLLIAGLMELPAKVSMPLYSKLKTQVDRQMGKSSEGSSLPWNKEE